MIRVEVRELTGGRFAAYVYVHLRENVIGGRASSRTFETAKDAYAWLHEQFRGMR